MLRFVWLEVCCTVNELGGGPKEGERMVVLCRGARREAGTTRSSAPRQAIKETPGLGEDYEVVENYYCDSMSVFLTYTK